MKTKLLTTLLGVAIFAVPAAVPASQPEVTLSDLRPVEQSTVTAADLMVLLRDPQEFAEFSLVLPSGFTTLDVVADPFAI